MRQPNLQAVNAAVSGRFDQVLAISKECNVVASTALKALIAFINREQEMSKIDLTPERSVLVIRHPKEKIFTKEFIEGLANTLGRDIITIPKDLDLDVVSELEMNSYGWYRKQ